MARGPANVLNTLAGPCQGDLFTDLFRLSVNFGLSVNNQAIDGPGNTG